MRPAFSVSREAGWLSSQLVTVTNSFKKAVNVVSRSLIKVVWLTGCLHQECLSGGYKARHLIMQAGCTHNRCLLNLALAFLFLFFFWLRKSLQVSLELCSLSIQRTERCIWDQSSWAQGFPEWVEFLHPLSFFSVNLEA